MAMVVHRPALPSGWRVAAAVVLVAAAALVVLAAPDPGRRGDPVASVRSPEQAIGAWVDDHRAEVFPGARGAYSGRCPVTGDQTLIGLCSGFVENLGDEQIFTIGVYATDWGADLLLRRTSEGWVVADHAPWPELGAPGAFGPPWSPQTAIAAWWSEHGAAWFGDGAVHLRSCADAGDVVTGQPVLCSTLGDDLGERRSYLSGLAGEPPVLRLVLERQDDRTWTVVASEPVDTW